MIKFNSSTKAYLRKMTSLILACIILITMASIPVLANDLVILPRSDYSGKLVIIHTNDTHGGDLAAEGEVIGTAGIAQLVKDYKSAGAEVLLVSAGDAIQGDPLVNLNQGLNAIEFMNLAGYDLMVPGNHEFDFGFDNLLELKEKANFPFLSANILDKESGDPIFDASIIIETAIGKVGIFGLTTPETMTKANPKNVATLNFLAEQDMYDAAKRK